MKPKRSFDELARINAQVEKRMARKSALPAECSGVKGRTRVEQIAPVEAPVEPEVVVDAEVDQDED